MRRDDLRSSGPQFGRNCFVVSGLAAAVLVQKHRGSFTTGISWVNVGKSHRKLFHRKEQRENTQCTRAGTNIQTRGLLQF